MPRREPKLISAARAAEHFESGIELMYGGFGGIGTPPLLISLLLESKAMDLRLIGNDAGFPAVGMGRVISAGRAKHLITSHIGSNPVAGRLMSEGSLTVEFFPQGTLAEKIRAGGAGLGGILVDVGLGTVFEEGRERVSVGRKSYLIEPALRSRLGIVYARAADEFGNLVFDKTARNFNPLVAMASDVTLVEAEQIVPAGSLDPEQIVTPGAFVDFIIQSTGVNWKWAWEQT